MSVTPLILSPKDKILNILVQANSIHYSISNENDQVYLRQEINLIRGRSAEGGIYEQFFNQPEMDILSDNVRIIFENSYYQLIPSEFFREENMQLVFELEHGKLKREQLHYIVLPKWGLHFVYKVPERMYKFFQNKYPGAHFDHHISEILKRKINKTTATIHAYVRKEEVDIIVIKEQKLQLASNFQVGSNEDTLYFLLNVYEQLGLDTADFPLHIRFKQGTNEVLLKLLGEYINNIKS